MTNSPLDAPTGFAPADNERPAGQWMESYWTQTAPWAKRFAYAVWFFCAWVVYAQASNLLAGSNIPSYEVVKRLGIVFLTAPVVALGYFSFRFGQDLERALAAQEQLQLESAFRQLHRFLIISLIIAAVWTVFAINQWFTAIHFKQSFDRNTPQVEQSIPLQSEGNTVPEEN